MNTIPYEVYKKITDAGCTPVEYIENTGNNAYIDTGIQVVNARGLYVDYQATQTPTRQCLIAGGMRTSSDGHFFFQYKGDGSSATNQYANYGENEYYNYATTDFQRTTVYLDDKDLYVNGSLVHRFTSSKGTARHNIYLFACNYGGQGVRDRGFVGKIYNAKVYGSDGTLARDFYPCVDGDETAGLFDVVEQAFYASSSSDEFAAGAAAEVDYSTLHIMRNGVPVQGLTLHKYVVDSVVMSLGDKITCDVYYPNNNLALTMQEYVEYDGVRYTIVNPPTIIREGLVSDNGEAKGMTKYSFVFYHPMYMLGNFPFTDVAINSAQEAYLSQDKTFSWIGTLFEMIAKINANLTGTQWIVTHNIPHFEQDGQTVTAMWQKANTNCEEVLSFDKQFISDALKTAFDNWEIPFIIDVIKTGQPYYADGKRFKVVFGLPTQEIYDSDGETPFVFQMGKGVGLKNNSRTPRENKIVTRICGYGSERNVPFGYPQIPWYGDPDDEYTGNGYPIYDGIVNGQPTRLIKHPFTRKTLMPSVYEETVFNKVSELIEGNHQNPNYNANLQIKDYYDATAEEHYTNVINANAPSVEIHQFEDIYPRLLDGQGNYYTLQSVNPYDGDFPIISKVQFQTYINQFIAASGNYKEKAALLDAYNKFDDPLFTQKTISAYGGSYTYLFEIVRKQAYFNQSEGVWYRLRYTSGDVNFEYIVYTGEYPPEVNAFWDDTVDNEGNYNQPNFKITLPILPFDLYACASVTEKMEINMQSGACLGCTFTVMVDWDDYKRNFYKQDGTFDPVIHTTENDGHVRDGQKYPDSSTTQLTVVVQKDTETFGTLIPNETRQPTSGDGFVILGISLPTSYITAAQQRLDDAMKQYMRENNIYYYDYPLKFDEYFLATHSDILMQMRNNNIVRFLFAGVQNALYIKQITKKYGEGVLPTYDITLTDDVEIVLNKIGQVTDDVSRLRVQVNELQKYYGDNVISVINEKLSRVADDVCQGRITFQQGLDAIGSVIFHDEIRTPDFNPNTYTGHGWRVDKLGNAEFESLRVRSYLEVVELIVNRLQAQEGDTMFTDNDQIEKVERRVNQQDHSVTYILSLKQKYNGYFTSQQYGNVIKGVINTMAAKQAGVSNVVTPNEPNPHGYPVATETDGENYYFTSWMRVIGTHATSPSTCGENQIQVVLYGDNQVPAAKNFEPCELMTIARWGCIDYSDPSSPDYETVKASIERRQRMFEISVTDGRVTKYTHVDRPIIRDYNYGVTIGELPDFVKSYPRVAQVLSEVGVHTDWLYAQGVVIQNYIQIDRIGVPIPTIVFCGDWVDGSQVTPSVGYGEYYASEFNQNTQRYETHEVNHKGGRWRCLQSQPVVSGGVSTYYEPKFNSPYWMLVDAYNTLHIEIESSMGEVFNDGSVNTTLTPTLKCGNVDITADTQTADWKWERSTESGTSAADATWNDAHTQTRVLNVTTQDMPAEWSDTNKAIFTSSVTVSLPAGSRLLISTYDDDDDDDDNNDNS